MNIVMIGGTFNPPHRGHLRLARTVLDSFGFEKVVFVPAFSPPHKSVADRVPPLKRLEMVRLAASQMEDVDVSDLEIQREGISWTIDTITQLSHLYQCPRPGLVIGDDHVPIFHTWKDPDALADKARLIVVKREGTDLSRFDWTHEFLDLQPDGISSAKIRKICREVGPEGIRELVPSLVLDYIRREGLYQDA